MVVAVTGASGQVGQALQKIADNYPNISWFFWSKDEVDITNQQILKDTFNKVLPDVVINLAAYTAVDRAETHYQDAFQLNVDAPRQVAIACEAIHAVLIHLSTDYVFDGATNKPYVETHKTAPLNVYGSTKLRGEEAVLQNCSRCFIVRSSWVYSGFGKNFYQTMLRLAREGHDISVVNDQIGKPTHALDLAQAVITIALSESTQYGIYHFANTGSTTWYEFAKKIFEINGLTPRVFPIASDEFAAPAKRPRYSILDTTKIEKTFGIKISSWEDALMNK